MADSKLDKIYQAKGDAEMRAAYDAWAEDYDSDLQQGGYLTPTRVADALSKHLPDCSAAVMDYGCGTGLSGLALDEHGFTCIDGVDLSQQMLDKAHATQVYRHLNLVEPDAPIDPAMADYAAVTAAGVISQGAGPASLLPQLMAAMRPNALLVFSLNDLSQSHPDYAGLVQSGVDAGEFTLIFEEHGPHIAKYGKNSGSTVYVLQKCG